MQTSTFAARETDAGWVIDATKIDGKVEQILGVFTSERSAVKWIAEHPAAWWKIHID